MDGHGPFVTQSPQPACLHHQMSHCAASAPEFKHDQESPAGVEASWPASGTVKLFLFIYKKAASSTQAGWDRSLSKTISSTHVKEGSFPPTHTPRDLGPHDMCLVHLLWIYLSNCMFFSILCLPWRGTPFFFHFIVGSGSPKASHSNTWASPMLKMPLSGFLSHKGGSVEKRKYMLAT